MRLSRWPGRKFDAPPLNAVHSEYFKKPLVQAAFYLRKKTQASILPAFVFLFSCAYRKSSCTLLIMSAICCAFFSMSATNVNCVRVRSTFCAGRVVWKYVSPDK